MSDQYLTPPRMTFTEQRMVNAVLSNSSLVGSANLRAGGTRYCVAMGVFSLVSGSGSVRLYIEGSVDGSNWFSLSETSSADDFTSSGQVILNASGTGLVDLQRVVFVRARAEVISGTPVFSLLAIVTGIARAGEASVLEYSLSRLGATPDSQYVEDIPRPEGTWFSNVLVIASDITLDGATSFDAVLDGSPDGGTTWVRIASQSFNAVGSEYLEVDSSFLLALSEFYTLRFGVVEVGSGGALSSYDIEFLFATDSSDWLSSPDGGGSGGGGSAEGLCSVTFDAPSAEVSDEISIGFQILNEDGTPITSARKVEVILYDSTNSGDLDLANNAIFTGIVTGTIISGLNTNRLLVLTDASGQAEVTIEDLGSETVYITAVNASGPSSLPQIIVEAQQATLTFA